MKNILCRTAAIIAMALTTQTGNAQMPYDISTTTAPYTSLSNATSINQGRVWSDTSNFTIPVGFSFNLGGIMVSSLTFSQSNLLLPSPEGVQNGFALFGTSLQDRGFPGGASVSPVSYSLSGSNGSRIFRLEVSNAGFASERDLYDTNGDSLSFQVWIYENDGSIEFRFGGSRISHFSDYFSDKVPLGFIRNLNMELFTFSKFYTLSGAPASPVIDSITTISTPAGMNAYPAAGTVYRFRPKGGATAIIGTPVTELGTIFPVPASDILYIESKASRYEILNMNGTVVRQGQLVNGRGRVALAGIVPGAYVARLYNNRNEVDIKKFIRQ